MSFLLRRAYGHGGTRLEHIAVCAPSSQLSPAPLWFRLSVLLILLAIPILVSRYALPTATLPTKTIIDISKLMIKPPPELPKYIEPEHNQAKPLERLEEHLPNPEIPPKVEPARVIERSTVPLMSADIPRPSVTRSSTAQSDEIDYQPRVTRERKAIDVVEGVPSARLRRESVSADVPMEKSTITRARGGGSIESTAAGERVSALRRNIPGNELQADSLHRPVTVRGTRTSDTFTENSQRVSSVKERVKFADNVAGGNESESASSIGLTRGISLMNLEICASSQQQEDAIKAVLSVVGDRHSCKSDKGEFQFKGTKRVSSFNLIIFPSKGRKPSHRCEELDNAYLCLKTH